MSAEVPAPPAGRSFVTPSRVIVMLILLGGGALLFLTPLREYGTLEWVRESLSALRSWVAAHWWSPAAYVVIFAVASLLWVPASVFVVTAAVLWGWKMGTLLAMIGALVGAALSFEASRWLLGEQIRQIIDRRAPRLLSTLENAGVRTVAILRLIPGIPFPLFNYGAGLASLRTRDFLTGSAIGLVAPTAIIAYSSEAILAGTLDSGQTLTRFVQVAALVTLLILLPAIVRRFFGLRKDVTKDPGPAAP